MSALFGKPPFVLNAGLASFADAIGSAAPRPGWNGRHRLVATVNRHRISEDRQPPRDRGRQCEGRGHYLTRSPN